jgi:enamine deaminase RidA (YjgF/YER057c/UK114 family)
MTRRQSIVVPQFRHGDLPFPVASRVDNIVYTSAISGYDLESKSYVDGAAAQVALMFDHLRAILAAAGATPDDVVRMTFYAKNAEARAAVNAGWIAMFPNKDSRPTRHILNYETPGASVIQCDAVAVLPGSSS